LLWLEAWELLEKKDRDLIPRDHAENPQSVLDYVEAEEKRAKGKAIKLPNGEVFFVHDVLKKTASWIKKFIEVGDTIVQYDPGHAALPWAALRFILQVPCFSKQ
jgi:predicted nicotinamide N-methyase